MGILSKLTGSNKPKPEYSIAKGRPFFKSKLSASEFKKWSSESKAVTLDPRVLNDRSKFIAPYIDALLIIPIVSASVWAWKWMVFTDNYLTYIGEDKRQDEARKVIADLDKRILPFGFTKGSGINAMLDQFLQSIFSYGRFAAHLEIPPTLNEISSVTILDGFNVYFKKVDSSFLPFYSKTASLDAKAVNPAKFFYYGLNMSHRNPYGTAMVESVPSLLDIMDEMMQDMRQSSHNAGLPRLHIKLKQPEILESETTEQYESRVNNYFTNTVEEMAEIGPDDNFYTWQDVEIGVAGGTNVGGFVWKANRNVVTEEILSGFHLFPWIIGSSAATTKNWVQAQFQLIVNQADSIQRIASNMIEWITNLELSLQGIKDVRVEHRFERPRDPSAKDLAVAEKFRIENVNTLISKGYISPDDGARRLGLDRMFDPERLYATQKAVRTKKETDDE